MDSTLLRTLLTKDRCLLKAPLVSILLQSKPSTGQLIELYRQVQSGFAQGVVCLKEMVVVLLLGLLASILFNEAITLLEELSSGKIIAHLVSLRKTVLYDNLFYLEQLLTEVVRYACQAHLTHRLTDSLIKMNEGSKFNEITFAVEALFIFKIRSFLTPLSQSAFNDFLNRTLSPKKLSLLDVPPTLTFLHTALLRNNEQSSELSDIALQPKLMRVKSSRALEGWVRGAFERVPVERPPAPSSSFPSAYCYLMRLEVFASSPLITEVEAFCQDIELFSSFLMGATMSQGTYEGGVGKYERAVKGIPPCYRRYLIDYCY